MQSAVSLARGCHAVAIVIILLLPATLIAAFLLGKAREALLKRRLRASQLPAKARLIHD